MMRIGKSVVGAVFALAAVLAHAQTFQLTAPTDGAFVGRSTTFTYNITGASQQVTVTIVATAPDGSKTTLVKKDTPNADGKITGSQTLSLSASSAEGLYTCVLTATEPSKTYPKITRKITVDGTKPKFKDFNPIGSVAVRGKVRIVATLDEANVDEWRVQVGGDDIPNNTGSSNAVSVLWDTNLVEFDGEQTVQIRVKDKSENVATQDITVNIDRIKPTAAIQFPRSGDVRPNATFQVQIDVSDRTIDPTGVDVLLTTSTGKYIMRVPRISANFNNGVLKWTGRVRKSVKLPSIFKIVVKSVDRAGNVGTTQTTTITVKK